MVKSLHDHGSYKPVILLFQTATSLSLCYVWHACINLYMHNNVSHLKMRFLDLGSSVYSYVSVVNSGSIYASAAINFGVAVFLLWLFAIFKRLPCNATVYYSRAINLNHHVPPYHDHSCLHKLVPSVHWIPHALHVTDNQILEENGLDALILIRLFKFGSDFSV